MNYYNSQTKEVLIAKKIEQAWRRRFLPHIHSGVRVKVQRTIYYEYKPTSSGQTNRIQSMLKRLWLESETSAISENGKESLQTIAKSYQAVPIFNNSSSRKNQSLRIDQKDKILNSIGMQTMMIRQIDRQISCHLIPSIPTLIRKSRSLSSTSSSETSISNENSTHTESTSTVSSSHTVTNERDSHYKRYRRNKNRNNNTINTKMKHINTKDSKMRKSMAQMPNHEQQFQDLNTQTASSPGSSLGRKRFFDAILALIPLPRLSPFKRNRISTSTTAIPTPIVTDMNENAKNKYVRSVTSRCRRSTARNSNHYPSIKSDETSLFKHDPLEQKSSRQSVVDKSISTENKERQVNHSKKKSSMTNRRKHMHRKNYSNRHRRCSSAQKLLLIPSIVSENPPSLIINDQSKILVAKSVKSLISHKEHSNYTYLSNHDEIEQTSLILPLINNNLPQDFISKSLNKQLSPPSIDSIRLRVQNKNLISSFSQFRISPSSIYPIDQSIQHHQTNIVNEFKSLLQQTKDLHTNNHHSTVNASAFKKDMNSK